MREATADDFAEQDILQQWLEEHTEDVGALVFTRVSELFVSWKDYCDPGNLRPGMSTTLSDLLASEGFAKKRESGVR